MKRNEFLKSVLAIPVAFYGIDYGVAPAPVVEPIKYAGAFKISERAFEAIAYSSAVVDKACKAICGAPWKSISNVDKDGYRTVRAFARDTSNNYAEDNGGEQIFIHDLSIYVP